MPRSRDKLVIIFAEAYKVVFLANCRHIEADDICSISQVDTEVDDKRDWGESTFLWLVCLKPCK